MILIQISVCVLFLKERGSEENSCHYMESDSNHVVLSNLRRATQYEVQVRARTFAGYGSFGQAVVFRTLPDGKDRFSPKAACCANLLAPMFVWPQSFVCEGFIDFFSLSVRIEANFFEIVSHLLDFFFFFLKSFSLFFFP